MQADTRTQKFKENVDPDRRTDIIILHLEQILPVLKIIRGEVRISYCLWPIITVMDSSQYFVQIRSNYFRQEEEIWTDCMYYNPELLSDLFDAQSVFDSSRPVPVPTMG